MKKPKTAVLIASNVIGGHEYQSIELIRDLKEVVDVTVYLNNSEHLEIFHSIGVEVILCQNKLLKPGKIPSHIVNGFWNRRMLRGVIKDYDAVLICAGAVEAGITASVALYGTAPLILYLPFFYDRILVWGKIGYLYNFILAIFCQFYDKILTINKIQAKLINRFTGIKTIVIPNSIRNVPVASAVRVGKLLFIGRLDPQKRVDELLQWIDFNKNPFKEIMVVGDGPERANLEKIAATMRYVNVKFTGWLNAEDQDKVVDKNDVLIMNSLVEGEPMVIKESNLRGIRVVVRDIVGVRGVTRKCQRFNSMFELRKILLSLNGKHNENFYVWSRKSIQTTRLHFVKRFLSAIDLESNA